MGSGGVTRIESVDVASNATSVVVTFSGELDRDICPLIRDAIVDICRSERDVAFEMSAVTFIDSGVLGALTALARPRRAAGRKLQIQHPSARVLNVLRSSGMLDLFDFTPPLNTVPTQPAPAGRAPLVIDLSNGSTRRAAPLS